MIHKIKGTIKVGDIMERKITFGVAVSFFILSIIFHILYTRFM